MNNEKDYIDTYTAFLNIVTNITSEEDKKKAGELLNKLLFDDEEVNDED